MSELITIRQVWIYLITDENAVPLYVGKTFNIHTRPKDHKYRWPTSQFFIIEAVSKEDNWKNRERFWIAYYRQWFKLENISRGGGGPGTQKQEVKDRIAASLRGRKRPQEVTDKMTAAHRTPQLRELKRRLASVPHSLERIEKNRQSHIGLTASPETRHNMSIAGSGKTKTKEHIAKCVATRKKTMAARKGQ